MFVKLLLRVLVSVVALFCTVSPSFATLVDNGTYVTDDESGLDWYKLTNTRGLTLSELSAELATSLSGWTFASEAQVSTLFSNVGLPTFTHDLSYFPVIQALTSKFGDSFSGYNEHFYGFYGYTLSGACSLCFANPRAFVSRDASSGPYQYLFVDTPGFVSSNFSAVAGPAAGALLIRTTAPIPEPEIYAMMGLGLGLLGWVGQRRRKQQTA